MESNPTELLKEYTIQLSDIEWKDSRRFEYSTKFTHRCFKQCIKNFNNTYLDYEEETCASKTISQ
jgi:hypothetical protein